jgi:hypothetical protein
MEQQISIVNGPSLLDLAMSLLQGNPTDHDKRLTVHFETDEDTTVTVAVSGLRQESGGGNSWEVTGYVVGYNPLSGGSGVKIYFDVNKRKGNMRSTRRASQKTTLYGKKVGDRIFRPRFSDLTMVDNDVPWEVVKDYILNRCPEANITGNMHGRAIDVIDQGPMSWADALAIVVSVHNEARVALIYKKDHVFMMLAGETLN